MNEVYLIGHSTSNVELKQNPKGMSLAHLCLVLKSRDPSKPDQYFDCMLFGKIAEFYAPLIKQDAELCLRGKLSSRQFTDRYGQRQTHFQIIVHWLRIIPVAPSSAYDDCQSYSL